MCRSLENIALLPMWAAAPHTSRNAVGGTGSIPGGSGYPEFLRCYSIRLPRYPMWCADAEGTPEAPLSRALPPTNRGEQQRVHQPMVDKTSVEPSARFGQHVADGGVRTHFEQRVIFTFANTDLLEPICDLNGLFTLKGP